MECPVKARHAQHYIPKWNLTQEELWALEKNVQDRQVRTDYGGDAHVHTGNFKMTGDSLLKGRPGASPFPFRLPCRQALLFCYPGFSGSRDGLAASEIARA